MAVHLSEPAGIVGREAERRDLQARIASAAAGSGGMVFLSGEAGIGKTLLAEECLSESPMHLLTGRAMEEATPAYGPIVSVLREGIRTLGFTRKDIGPLAPYLAILLPELGTAPDTPDRETLVESIASALAAFARSEPIAILLDDLQWADSATIEVLPSLVDRIKEDPILITATYRSDELPRGHRIRWLRNELRRRRQLDEINLSPLSREETAHLLENLLGGPPSRDLLRSIHEQTNGLPFFIEELTNSLLQQRVLRKDGSGYCLPPGQDVPLPESLRDAILVRLEGLSDRAHTQLEIAATAGTEFSLEMVSELAETHDGLDELIDHSLIVEGGHGTARFRHDLMREAIRNSIPWSRRRTLNRRIAEHLEASGEPVEKTAEYWLAAGEHSQAREGYLAQARAFCVLHAHWDAVAAGRQALAIWPENEDTARRLDVIEQLANCAQLSGQLLVATDAWKELVGHPLMPNEPQRLARAQRALATLYDLQGKWDPSSDAHAAAQRLFEQTGAFDEASVEAALLGEISLVKLEIAEAGKHMHKAVRLAEQAGRSDLTARALALEGYALAIRGNIDEATRCVQQGLAIAINSGLSDVAYEVYRRMAGVLEYSSLPKQASEAYLNLVDQCRQQGEDLLASDCLGCLSYVLFRAGDWGRAIPIAQKVLGNPDLCPFSRATGTASLTLIHLFRGENKQARRYLEKTVELTEQFDLRLFKVLNHWIIGLFHEFANEKPQAAECFRKLLDEWFQTEDRHDAISGMLCSSALFGELGMRAELSRCTEALSLIVKDTGNPEATAALSISLGETALADGKPLEASEQFLRAADRFAKLGIPFETARGHFRAGVAFNAAGKKQEAVRYLGKSYQAFKNLGARALTVEIAASLQELGEHPEERGQNDPTTATNLTRRQTEILRHIADGLTNKEIAGKLHLSPRTVEMHAANILDRLDCRSRSEAVGKAAEMGLLT